jgi:RNA polymerase sigma-70 factor (ECF subfamily)
MTVESTPGLPMTFGELGFDAFYTRNLPIVYGYALRLCGGEVERAQDLAQEAWVAFVDEARSGSADRLDVRWLVTVVRNRHVDNWRRARRLESKLGLVWNTSRDDDADELVTRQQVVDRLIELEDDHRVVLALRYIDGLPVDEIATTISRTTTATYSLLARAREELRRRVAASVPEGAP